jgi:hypothetical protein
MNDIDKWLEIVEKFSGIPDYEIPRTKEGREFWRQLGHSGMHSGLGEYTPITEFDILLDYIDELETKLAAQQSVHQTLRPIR